MKVFKILFFSAVIIELFNIIDQKVFKLLGLNDNYGKFSSLILLIVSLIIFFSLKIIYQKYDYKISFWKLFLFGIIIIMFEYFLNFIVQSIDFYILKNEITNQDFTNVPDYMREFERKPRFNPITDLVFAPIQIFVWKIMENKDFLGFLRWTVANRLSLNLIIAFLTFKIYKKKPLQKIYDFEQST